MASTPAFRVRAIVVVGLVAVALPMAVISAQPERVRTVLTIHWSAPDFPTTPIHDRGIQQALRAGDEFPLEYFAEYLESDRVAPDVADAALRDYIRAKYAGRRFDVVIAVSNSALEFVVRHREELFRDVPVVFMGRPVSEDLLRAGAGMTGVISTTGFDQTLTLALGLHPSTEQVFVVASSPSPAYLDAIKAELRPFADRVRLNYINESSVARLIDALKAVPPRSVVLFIRHSQETPGHVVYPDEVARLAIPAAAVPVYGTSDIYLGSGIVGGVVRGTEANSVQAGELARRILMGARAQDLPPVEGRVTTVFDWRQLHQWGIDEARLPADAQIHFKTPTPWALYRGYILGALVFMLAQAITIGALVVQRARRRKTEAGRNRAEASLREGQERYQRAIAAGGVAVWERNMVTNEVRVDPLFKEMVGIDPREVGPDVDNWWSLVHPDDVQVMVARLEEHLRDRTPFFEAEHRVRHRDGSLVWFVTRGSVVRVDDQPVWLHGTSTNITARKQSEIALAAAQAELARVFRLKVLGEFAASIGHEVRQPLAGIAMNAETCRRLLERDTPDFETVRDILGHILSDCDRADQVIRRNSELFRHRKVQKTALDMNGVILEVAGFLQTRLQAAHVTLVTTLSAGLPPVHADRVELQQVLINLLLNSLDAMENVEARFRRIEVSSAITRDDTVIVSVSDSGVGFDGVDTNLMFMPAYTTKTNGTGVGLSICRSIVEAHNGRLWAEANAAGGATFSFTLPLQPAPALAGSR